VRKNWDYGIARKFDSKGNAGSEFSEPPASFIAARTFVLDDTSSPSRRRVGFSIQFVCQCSNLKKDAFIQRLGSQTIKQIQSKPCCIRLHLHKKRTQQDFA
jgi:hypothetical protein